MDDRFANGASEDEILEFLKALFSRCMNVPVAELDDEESFFSLGLTSLIHQEIINNLTKAFGELPSTVLFEYPNFGLLAGYLLQIMPKPSLQSDSQGGERA